MFASVVLTVVFTLVFTVTAAYALLRFAGSGDRAPGDRLVTLFHLLMSLAMVAMAWAWTGGPATPGGIVQILVFGGFTLWFAARTATPAAAHGRVAGAYHLVTGAAMTWMVAAMPLMMGASMVGASGAAGGHAAHAGADAAGGAGALAPDAARPPWVTVVSLAFVVLLLVAVAWSAAQLARDGDAAPLDGPDAGGGTAVRTRPAVARTDAAAHLLMSLGMAGMLLAML